MRWLLFIASLCLFALMARLSHAAKAPKVLYLSESDVANISTALRYSTILQFDAKPTSVVVGDQDAFKVEYVGNSLTIKPIFPGATTNLFVLTDYDRFNFKLMTGSEGNADYIVRVKKKYNEKSSQVPESSSSLITRNIQKKIVKKGWGLSVDSLSWPKSESVLIIKFSLLRTVDAKPTNIAFFEPGDLALYQGGTSIPIESLYLDRLEFSEPGRLSGTLIIRKNRLLRKTPLKLEFSGNFLGKESLSITFPSK